MDIVGSTKMTMYPSLQQLKFTIKLFWEQISFTIEKHEGLVFKYVCEAVIAIFVDNKDRAGLHVIECGQDIFSTLRNYINSDILGKRIPRVSIKIGMDNGNVLIVSFGCNVNLIGFALSFVSKITSTASANIVLIGEFTFEQTCRDKRLTQKLHPSDYHVIK